MYCFVLAIIKFLGFVENHQEIPVVFEDSF